MPEYLIHSGRDLTHQFWHTSRIMPIFRATPKGRPKAASVNVFAWIPLIHRAKTLILTMIGIDESVPPWDDLMSFLTPLHDAISATRSANTYSIRDCHQYHSMVDPTISRARGAVHAMYNWKDERWLVSGHFCTGALWHMIHKNSSRHYSRHTGFHDVLCSLARVTSFP